MHASARRFFAVRRRCRGDESDFLGLREFVGPGVVSKLRELFLGINDE